MAKFKVCTLENIQKKKQENWDYKDGVKILKKELL